jgi:PAS domain S-box-containing protein
VAEGALVKTAVVKSGRMNLGNAEGAVATPSQEEARLADAAMALLGCHSEEDVYEVIRAFMGALCPDAVLIINETSPDMEWLITRHLYGLDDSMLMKAATMVGFDPVGKRSAIARVHQEELLSGTLSKVSGGFVELASFEVPRVVAQLTADAFRLFDAFSIGISDGSSVLANIQVYTRVPGVKLPTALVETFAHHCYSTLASIGSVRKLAESAERVESLLDRDRLLQLFFDRNPDGVVVLDPESGRALHFNEAAHRQLGFTREEFAVLEIRDLEANPTELGMREHIERVMHEGRAAFETTHITKGGEIRDVRVTARRIDTASEAVYFSIFRDITEQKTAEREAQRQADTIDLLLDSTVEGILGFDLEGRITFCNDSSLEMLGYNNEDDVLGKVGHDLFHSKHPDGTSYRAADCPVQQMLNSGASVHRDDEVFWRADGTSVPVEYWSRPMLKDGQMIGSELSFLDVTERDRVNEVLLCANQRLEGVLKGVIETLGRVVETRDPYTKGHEQGVARIAKQIAIEMGLLDHEVDGVEVAALVHDVGKLGVPAEILSKPSALSAIEFELIKFHAQGGHDILVDIDFDWPLAEIVLQHHERMDGSGYPNGLRGDDIMMAARILMVADVIDAMAADRPYRAALGLDAAIAEITRHAEKFDAQVVSACMRLYEAGMIEV